LWIDGIYDCQGLALRSLKETLGFLKSSADFFSGGTNECKVTLEATERIESAKRAPQVPYRHPGVG